MPPVAATLACTNHAVESAHRKQSPLASAAGAPSPRATLPAAGCPRQASGLSSAPRCGHDASPVGIKRSEVCVDIPPVATTLASSFFCGARGSASGFLPGYVCVGDIRRYRQPRMLRFAGA
mgnify:CR=1 FL=1